MLTALQVHAGVRELGVRRGPLRRNSLERRFGLGDLLVHLTPFEPERSFALLHLDAHALGRVRVELAFLPELVEREHRDELVLVDGIALVDQQLLEPPADLRADDDFVGGDDAGQDQRRGRAVVVPDAGGDTRDQEDENEKTANHVCDKQLYETGV